MNTSKHSEEKRKQVVESIEAGEITYETAAQALKVCKGTLVNWRRRYGNGQRLTSKPLPTASKSKKKRRTAQMVRMRAKDIDDQKLSGINKMALESQIARVMDERLGRMFMMLGKVLTRQ